MTVDPRPPRAEDAEHYARLLGDARVGATLWPGSLGGPRSPEQAGEFLAHDVEHWADHGFGPWLWLEGEAVAARGGLERTDVGGRATVEVSYAVLPGWWGRGLAARIARHAVVHARAIGLEEVVGFAWTENPASIRVLEKAGLRFEREIEHAGLPHWFGRLPL